MINVTLTDTTPANMLRAIRAACNELLGETPTDLTTQAAEHNSRAVALHAAAEAESDKAAAALSAHNSAEPVPSEERAAALLGSVIETTCLKDSERKYEVDGVETDSAGQPWSAELHSSSRAKIADGTWKKRRNAGKDSKQEVEEMLAEEHSPAPAVPPVPPTPRAPTAEPIMPKIFALITSQIVTINQAVEAAQAEGYADLGANGLGGAPREAQEAVLRKLEG